MLVSAIISCGLLITPTIDDVNDYMTCRYAYKQVEHVQEWIPLIDKYFDKPDHKIKSLRIIFCESSGKADAIGSNKNGTKDVGLWQFNDKTWAWLKPKLGIISKRTNPEVSTSVAAWLIKHDGWHHWNSSKHCWENK